MNCQDTRDKFSAYIDGMLEENEADLVRDHLEYCVKCREEYADMTRIIGYMQKMESPDPSKVFLQNVNERLTKSFAFKTMLKCFFFPWQIKLPLELAGIAVVFILVVYISGIWPGRRIYDLSYSLKTQTVSDIQEKRGEKGEKQEKKGEPKKGEKREIDLQEIIRSLDGQVIKSEFTEDGKILKSLIIHIPANKFNRFFQKLQELGQVQEPLPVIKEKDKKLIKIRIRLLDSKINK